MDALSLRAATLLGLSGASLALFFQQLGGHWVSGFIARNDLSLPNRRLLLITMAAGFLLGAGASLIARWLRGPVVAPRLRAIAALVSPVALLGLVPGLLQLREWSPLNAGLAILVFALLVELAVSAAGQGRELLGATLRGPRWLTAWRGAGRDLAAFVDGPWVTGGLALLAWAIGAVALSAQALHLFRRFALPDHELGLWYAALSTGAPSRLLAQVAGWPEAARPLGLHPTAALLIPLLRLHPSAETLLVLRAIVSAASAPLVWLMTSGRMSRSRQAVLVALALFWPAWQASTLSDFSLAPFAATFFLAGFAAAVRGETPAAGVAFLLTLGCGEDGAALVLLFGIGVAFRGPRRGVGLALGFLGAAVTALIVWAGSGHPDAGAPVVLDGFLSLWRNPVATVSTWGTPDRLQLLVMALAPLAALPLRAAGAGWGLVSGLWLVLAPLTLPPDLRRFGLFVAFALPAMALAFREARCARLASVGAALALSATLWGLLPARADAHACPWLAGVSLRLAPDEADQARQDELDAVVAAAPAGLMLAPLSTLAHVRSPRGVRLGPLRSEDAAQLAGADVRAVLVGATPGQPGHPQMAAATAAGFHPVKNLGAWTLLAR